eukprot:162063-Chlamydomonas_euryale.AAC.1
MQRRLPACAGKVDVRVVNRQRTQQLHVAALGRAVQRREAAGAAHVGMCAAREQRLHHAQLARHHGAVHRGVAVLGGAAQCGTLLVGRGALTVARRVWAVWLESLAVCCWVSGTGVGNSCCCSSSAAAAAASAAAAAAAGFHVVFMLAACCFC